MKNEPLGRLETVDLRDYWEREDTDFSTWLADEENIKLLGDTVGIELEVERQEANVGPFRADILCRNVSDSSFVVIENQIERTDHSHLGQLITYAAGLDAVTLIWIVRSFVEEHRAAIDWLNNVTDESVRFFGLEVELWRIGDSKPAPHFNMVAKPNDWSKSVKGTVKGEVSVKEQRLYRFWEIFAQTNAAAKSRFKASRPHYSNWAGYGIGAAGCKMAVHIYFKSGYVDVAVEINSQESPDKFSALLADKDAITAACGFELEWEENPGYRFSRIRVKKAGDLQNEAAWPTLQQWILETMAVLDNVFRPRLREIE